MQSRVCWWQQAFRISHFYGVCGCVMFFCCLKISDDAGGIEYHLAAAIKKKPLRQGRRGCFFSSHSAAVGRAGGASAADIGADDVAEPLPGFALKPHELQLRKRGKVAGAGVDLDARQQAAQLKPFYAGRLLHDVLAREIVATLLQY